MRKNVVFLTDNIFLKKDFDRFGIEFLSKKFNIQIFNLSKLTNPNFLKILKNFLIKSIKTLK